MRGTSCASSSSGAADRSNSLQGRRLSSSGGSSGSPHGGGIMRGSLSNGSIPAMQPSSSRVALSLGAGGAPRFGSSAPRPLLLLLLVLLLVLPASVAASSGDASWDFKCCTAACEATGCASAPAQGQQPLPGLHQCSPLCIPGASGTPSKEEARPPLTLRLWRWDCSADCCYLCMWQREEGKAAAAASGASGARPPSAEKYYGKWPFKRVLGMQEPASVLLSLLNLAAQLRCLQCCLRLRAVRRAAAGGGPSAAAAASQYASSSAGRAAGAAAGSAGAAALDRGAAHRTCPLWLAHFSLSAVAWLCSAIFHGRDTPLTERLDYYAAGALVAFNLFLTSARTLPRLASPLSRLALAAAILAYYARHIFHMQLKLFDYGLHVKTCIVAGVLQAALWVRWAAGTAPRSHRGRPWLLAFVVLIHASMLLEVFDFPPYWHIMDAHACWHAATIPLAHVWYRFVQEDWLYGLAASSKQAE